MDSITLIKAGFDLLMLSACGYALWAGTMVEKGGASIAIIAAATSAISAAAIHRLGLPGRYACLATDVAALLAFGFLMMRSRAFWPIWATGFQLAAVSTDMASVLWRTLQLPLWLLSGFWAIPVIGALYLGTLRASRLRREGLLVPRPATPRTRVRR